MCVGTRFCLLGTRKQVFGDRVSDYEPVIGLEVHCQLKTRSKIFSGDSYVFGAEANTHVGPVTLGLPGVLPVLNQDVLQKAIMAGLALDCQIAHVTKFDRKHYFYPDLPKGYQISQYDMPYAEHGHLEFHKKDQAEPIRIGITRIHMEEDAGKLLHSQQPGVNISYVDLNRAGVPLLEIVSEPDLRTAEDAYHYLVTLKNILRYIEVSDCNMEEGTLRCDANVSLRPRGRKEFGTRVEIKNLNSFKGVRAAIEYEIERQTEVLDRGGIVQQCTALWDADRRETRVMRMKEDAEDYRYFPEPDLPVFHVEADMVARIRETMPELPRAKKARFSTQYSIPEYDADVLTRQRVVADYFEQVVVASGDAKKSSNWVKDEVLAILNKNDWEIEAFPVPAANLGRMIGLINGGSITSRMAKDIFEHMVEDRLSPEQVIEKYDLRATDSDELPAMVDRVLRDNPDPVAKILAGNDRVRGFLVGQVMKASEGQAHPEEVNRLVGAALDRMKQES